jgi:hypothetical protein
MKCNICEHLYNTTITMQTIGGHGIICHSCIEKSVKFYVNRFRTRKVSEQRKKVPYVKDGLVHCCQKEMEFVEETNGHLCNVCGGEI